MQVDSFRYARFTILSSMKTAAWKWKFRTAFNISCNCIKTIHSYLPIETLSKKMHVICTQNYTHFIYVYVTFPLKRGYSTKGLFVAYTKEDVF